jgi:hypothetical protein
MSVFDAYEQDVYKYRYRCELAVSNIHGGVPSNPNVAKGWLKTKFKDKDELVVELINTTMIERGLEPGTDVDETTLDGILDEAVKMRQLSGFYRHPDTGELSIRGRHVKAMIKEAANIAYAKERWGPTRKGTKSFFAEHVFVAEDWIPLGRTAPDGVDQRFVSTWRGTGIQYDEFVEDVKVGFTVLTDHKFSKKDWAILWVTAQHNGLGAARSQGYGTFSVETWDLMD